MHGQWKMASHRTARLQFTVGHGSLCACEKKIILIVHILSVMRPCVRMQMCAENVAFSANLRDAPTRQNHALHLHHRRRSHRSTNSHFMPFCNASVHLDTIQLTSERFIIMTRLACTRASSSATCSFQRPASNFPVSLLHRALV